MKKLLMLIAIVIITLLLIGNIIKKESTEWEEYVVQSGDTVCDIAIGITPDDIDYRKTEHDITKVNNIKNALLHPGQTIFVPVYE